MQKNPLFKSNVIMKIFKLPCFMFCFLLCISCNKEDDFVELSAYDDFMMELTIYFDTNNLNESYEFEIIDYKTNGYDELISYPSSFEGGNSKSPKTVYMAVKEYKTVGIKIIPIKNIMGFRFTIKEISPLYPESLQVLNIEENINGDTEIFYDFETKEYSIVNN